MIETGGKSASYLNLVRLALCEIPNQEYNFLDTADTAEVLSTSGTSLFWHPRVSKVVQDVKYEQECDNDEECECSSPSVLKFAALCHYAKN